MTYKKVGGLKLCLNDEVVNEIDCNGNDSDDGWYEVTPQDVVTIDAYNEVPHDRYYKLEDGDIISVSKSSVGCELRVGDKWPGYPFMTCVGVCYEPHRWWQFWKMAEVGGL